MANQWTKSQQMAIKLKDSNILVSAAAGSGKTAVLVERIIRKITDADNPVSIDRLVVVTFTKAAAAEMKHRIRLELDQLIEDNPGDQNLIRQQILINNAKITTIDSFCLDIVRNYFTETDIDPGFRTADEGEIRLLENDVMNQMLEEYYGAQDTAFTALVDAYATGRDDGKLVEMILKIYRFARSYPWEDVWYDNSLKMYDTADEDIDNNICVRFMWDNFRKVLGEYRERYEEYLAICESPDGPKPYAENIQQDISLIDMLLAADTFERFVKLVKESSFNRLNRCVKPENEEKKAYVAEGRDAFKAYVEKTIKKCVPSSVDGMKRDIAINRPAVEMLVTLARDFSRRMQEEKRTRNIIDFNDMEHLALDILVKYGEDGLSYTAAADALSDYYEEILIDEYQDSNMLQEQILTAVSKTRRAECHNNIYMVGDVKQSIYRFRMACPELFIEKSDSYEAATEGKEAVEADSLKTYVKIQLQNNFRSRDNILNSTNRVFERIMTREYGGIAYDSDAALYHGAEYAECPEYVIDGDRQLVASDFGKECTSEVHLFEKDGTDLSSAEAEACLIGDIIRDLMDTSDGSVRVVADKSAANGYRPLRYSDIVIISRTIKDFAQVIVNSLMNQGIPAYTENSKGFFAVHEIQLVLSFLTVIDNPLNDIPMAAVMMSYFGRMTSRDVAVLRNVDKKAKLYDLLKASQDEKAVALCSLIEVYRDKSDAMSVYDLLWDVLYGTGFYDYVGTMPSGERRQANLDILLQKASDYEKTSYRGLFNFLRYVERLQTYDVELGEASVLTEKDNIVRVMSIHKSKGLEFPVVIIAGMGKRMDHKDSYGSVITHQTYGIGTDVVRLDNRTKSPTVIKNAIAMAVKEEDTSEFMRVLYVAMTRAREKLIMTGQVASLESAHKKWDQLSKELESKPAYSYSQIDGCTSFLDMVVPVALLSESNDGDNTFAVYEHEQIEVPDFKTEENAETVYRQHTEIPEYPHDSEQNIKSKVTVSELKKLLSDGDFEENDMLEESVRHAVNEEGNDAKEQGLFGSERGSAYHRVMECLNYSMLNEDGVDVQLEVDKMLEQLLTDRRITKEQHDCINAADIVAFISAPVGKRALKAYNGGTLRREQPFVYIDDAIPQQLVQGVIDMYFIEDGKLVVVDYKTDRVPRKGGEEILIERYSVQLDYYARALSQILDMPVAEKIIYSFALGREISLEVGGEI